MSTPTTTFEKLYTEFLIGADPELMITKDGKHVRARNVFYPQDDFGCDGCDDVAEIRPGKAKSPLELTTRIHALLVLGHKIDNKMCFHAGSHVNGYPIGGHIHFATPANETILNNLQILYEEFEKIVFCPAGLKERQKTGYGNPKTIRRNDYGFEYRTPASWLLSPEITFVAICLAKIAVWNRRINITNKYLQSKLTIKEFLLNLEDFIEVPEDCKDYKKELANIFDNNITQESLNTDILVNWNIKEV